MTTRTGGQLVVDTLRNRNVRVLFGIPGVHTLDIYDALLDQNEIRHILNRHEQGCGFMADGYARASGTPGVCIVITGPGLTNIATPLGQAYSDSSPVVVISSEIDSRLLGKGRGVLHEMKHQAGFMEQITRHSAHASSPAQIPSLLEAAWDHHRREHPGPVHVQIPLDVLAQSCPAPLFSSAPAGARRASQQQIEAAANMLVAAERPLILVGAGAQDVRDLTPLAECLGAFVFSTALGRGIISDDHPLALGNTMGQKEAEEILDRSDMVLALGTSLRALAQSSAFNGKVIHVNLDGAEIGRNCPVHLGVRSDSAVFVEQLLMELSARGVSKASPSSRPTFESEINPWTQGVLGALRSALGRDGILAVDMTLVAYRCSGAYPVYQPRTFLSPHGFGTLGFAPPAAMGAHLARPNKRVIALVGDGGFMFTLEELAVAVQEQLNVTIVVVNSQSYEVVGRMHRRRFERDLPVALATPCFQTLAEAFGVMSLRAQDGDHLAYALEETATHQGPVLIELPYQEE